MLSFALFFVSKWPATWTKLWDTTFFYLKYFSALLLLPVFKNIRISVAQSNFLHSYYRNPAAQKLYLPRLTLYHLASVHNPIPIIFQSRSVRPSTTNRNNSLPHRTGTDRNVSCLSPALWIYKAMMMPMLIQSVSRGLFTRFLLASVSSLPVFEGVGVSFFH